MALTGLLVSGMLFFRLAAYIGGPTEGDFGVSAYSTWLIQHGNLVCAWAPGGKFKYNVLTVPYTHIAPLYPLVSGALAYLFQVGTHVAFPASSAMGSHCATAYHLALQWAMKSRAINSTMNVGYVMWLPLAMSVTSLLRTTKRGRTLWEPATLCFLAVCPPLIECITGYFHPQDLLTMSLILAGVAQVRRSHWTWAGVLFALAMLTNQFALLPLLAIVVVMPSRPRRAFIGSLALTYVVPAALLIAVTHGQITQSLALGSGAYKGVWGGTLLWDTGLRGAKLTALARGLPVLTTLLGAWWVRRHWPDVIANAPLLLSLLSFTFFSRLMFEENLWAYYFTALTVMLVLADVVAGRLRGQVVAWIALGTMAFNPIPWAFAPNGLVLHNGLQIRNDLPNVIMIIGALVLLGNLVRRRVRWYLVAWLGVALAAFYRFPWMHSNYRVAWPRGVWQALLLLPALYLTVEPFVKARRAQRVTLSDSVEPLEVP